MLFSKNRKMKKSEKSGVSIYNFGIPAFRSLEGESTCPMAGVCAAGCYAMSGAYSWSNVKNAYETRYQATKKDDFHLIASSEIEKLKKKRGVKQLIIRIHDSGDFYSEAYFKKWLLIMLKNPDVKFYAYTKMIEFFKNRSLPNNFTLIFSLGGKQDSLIDQSNERHSKVFQSVKELKEAGYSDASNDDMIALGKNKKIGLVYHGAKNFENTAWSRVDQKTAAIAA